MSDIDIEALSLGATFLGAGGGGATDMPQLVYAGLGAQGKVARILPLTAFAPEDYIVPVAYMGAPLVAQELPISLKALQMVLAAVVADCGPIKALMPGEIGGANALVPLILGAALDLPVIDGDLIGRAFPELQMSSLSVLPNTVRARAYLATHQGKIYTFENPNIPALEAACREACIQEGSSIALAIYPMTVAQARTCILEGSYTQALAIGKALEQGALPLDTHFVVEGVVGRCTQSLQAGFLVGELEIIASNGPYILRYQNEFIDLCGPDGQPLAQSPDVIAVLEAYQSHPLSTETLQYGQRVRCYSYPCHPIWKSEKGLALVKPEAWNENRH